MRSLLPLLSLPPKVRLGLSALLALMAAVVFFVYAGPGAADRAQAAAIRTLAEQVHREDADLTRRMRDPAGGPPEAAPEPLRQLDAAIGGSGVRVLRLSPRPSPPGSYDVELDTDFPSLLRFTAAIEAPGGTLRTVQFRRKDSAVSRLFASVTVTVAAPNATPTPPIVASGRDPFAPPAAAARSNHRLTGITRVGNGWMATIDDRDYVLGDTLDSAQVVSVGEQEVVLSTSGVDTIIRLPEDQPRDFRPVK